MEDGLSENIEPQTGQSLERPGRKRRFGVQVPLYKKDLRPPSARLSADEYHAAVERQLKYQENLRRKRITPKHIAIGIAILLFDVVILQLPPYIIKVIGIYDQVLLGQWLVGLAGGITVATFIYIFTSGR
jgi:hypothetical protein